MDVTPTTKMFEAMQKLTDAAIGEAPSRLEVSDAANARRLRRQVMMDCLHSLVATAMREGVNRAVRDARARLYGPQDGADRSAMSQARDDAERGGKIIKMPEH